MNKPYLYWKKDVALLVAVALSLLGCGKKSETDGGGKIYQTLLGMNTETENSDNNHNELLIYCGITMIAPMTEIAEIIEKQENCHIRITKDGSGNLLKSIVHNQTGDLYLPGSDRYHKMIEEQYDGLVIERTFVGYNKAVLLVQKGNPDGFTADLKQLVDPHFGVIIGDPDSGSIGKEAKAILDRAGIFDAVVNNAMIFATDSKDILKAVKSGQADVGINWCATATWGDNDQYIDVIEIDPKFSKPKSLIIGMLKYTEHPEICRAFMELASSEQGHEIFRKHGLYFDPE